MVSLTFAQLVGLAAITALFTLIATTVGFGINFILTSGAAKINREHELKRDKDRREHELKRDKVLQLDNAKRKVFAEVAGTLFPYLQKWSFDSNLIKTSDDYVRLNDRTADLWGAIETAHFYCLPDGEVNRLLVQTQSGLTDLNSALVITNNELQVNGEKFKAAADVLIKLSTKLMEAMQKELGIEAEASAK